MRLMKLESTLANNLNFHGCIPEEHFARIPCEICFETYMNFMGSWNCAKIHA